MTGTDILMTGAEALATASQGWSNTGLIMYAVIALLVLIGGSQFYVASVNKRAKEWLEKNPSASKVYIKTLNLLVYSQELTVSAVDNEPPVFFFEKLGLKKGFYLLPGTRVVTSSFTSKRIGFFHKEVSTTYESSENQVEVKQGITYEYGFSTSKENYTFKAKK